MIVSRDGWVKRQKEVKGGVAYTSRIAEIPASTGYGEPIQRFFKLKDGEEDRRRDESTSGPSATSPQRRRGPNLPCTPWRQRATAHALRFSLESFVKPSTRAGRRFARVPEKAAVMDVERYTGDEVLIAATGLRRIPPHVTMVSIAAHRAFLSTFTPIVVKEARRAGGVKIAATIEGEKFARVPTQAELTLDPDAAYVHCTTNNTIYGTEFHYVPEVGAVPLVADTSSDMFSRPIDVSKFALL